MLVFSYNDKEDEHAFLIRYFDLEMVQVDGLNHDHNHNGLLNCDSKSHVPYTPHQFH